MGRRVAAGEITLSLLNELLPIDGAKIIDISMHPENSESMILIVQGDTLPETAEGQLMPWRMIRFKRSYGETIGSLEE